MRHQFAAQNKKYQSKLSCLLFIFCLLSQVVKAQEPKLVLPMGHKGTAYTASFSPNGRYMVSSGTENLIYFWDVQTGRLLKTLAGYQYPGIQSFFSKDGKNIIAIGNVAEPENCMIWDFLYEKPVVRFSINPSDELYQPTNKLLIRRAVDSTFIYDLTKRKFIHQYSNSAQSAPVMDSKGNMLQVVKEHGRYIIKRYDTAHFKLIGQTALPLEIKAPESSDDERIEFSPSAQYLCVLKRNVGNENFSSENLGQIFLIRTADGALIYAGNASFKEGPYRVYVGEEPILFDQTESRLIWRAVPSPLIEDRFRSFLDEIAVLDIKEKTVKKQLADDISKNSFLKDSLLFSLSTARVSIKDTGTLNRTYIKATNIYTGKRKIFGHFNGVLTSFSVNNKYLLCSAEGGDLIVYGNDKKLSSYLIDLSTGKQLFFPEMVGIVGRSKGFTNTRLALQELNNDGLYIYDLQKQPHLMSIAEAKTIKAPMLTFIHRDSLLYTGNRILNIKNGDGSKAVPGVFKDYNDTLLKAKLYNEKDSISTIYDLRKLAVQKSLKGLFKERIAEDGNYRWNDQSLDIWNGMLTVDSNYLRFARWNTLPEIKTPEKLIAIDDSLYYMVTVKKEADMVNPNFNNAPKKAFSLNKVDNRSGQTGHTSLWDLRTQKLRKAFDLEFEESATDGKGRLTYLIMVNEKDTSGIWVYDIQRDKLQSFPGDFKAIADDQKTFYTTLSDNKFNKYEFEQGKLIGMVDEIPKKEKDKEDDIRRVIEWQMEKTELVLAHDGKATISSLNRKQPEIVVQLPLSTDFTYKRPKNQLDVFVSNPFTGQHFIAFDMENTFYLNPGQKAERLKTLPTETIISAKYVGENGAYLQTSSQLSGDFIYFVSLWDSKTYERIYRRHSTLFEVSEDGKLAAFHDAGKTTILSLPSAKPLFTFIELDSINYLNKLENGYYMATPGASKQIHYVTKDLKAITFEQLDVKYNRPDKVLRAIGSTDTALIESYQKAYEKRIKKLGIDTNSFKSGYSIPEADFKNRNKINYQSNQRQLQLQISGNDKIFNLERFNVWINETPLFGLKGVNLKHRKKKFIDTLITVQLSDGLNRIETSVTNTNGAESYHIPLEITYIPAKPALQKLYFVGIGINKFSSAENNLLWSVKDIRDLANELKAKYKENIHIDTLFNEQVTIANVKALKKKLLTSGINDKVIIAYSGHGILSADFDYFLSTYAVDFNNPEKNGLPYDVLEDLVDRIPARQKLMLIDACHSGEVDREELKKINAAEQTLAANGVSGRKGTKVINIGPRKAGMKTSLELMQQLFVNVGQGTGATIISAAGGTQFALEKSELQNGVFSYSILEYLKSKNHVSVGELQKYVNKRVVELTAGLQVPTTRSKPNAFDWQVW